MKLPLAALLAAAFAASATPAAACGFFDCVSWALADDSYPPGQTALPPDIQVQVIARGGKGLSLAGFYNDPAVALARAEAGWAYGGPAAGPAPGYALRRRY